MDAEIEIVRQELETEMNELRVFLERHETIIGLRCVKLILETANPEVSLLIPLLLANREEMADGSNLVCDSED
jgi:hypothetical protein